MLKGEPSPAGVFGDAATKLANEVIQLREENARIKSEYSAYQQQAVKFVTEWQIALDERDRLRIQLQIEIEANETFTEGIEERDRLKVALNPSEEEVYEAMGKSNPNSYFHGYNDAVQWMKDRAK